MKHIYFKPLPVNKTQVQDKPQKSERQRQPDDSHRKIYMDDIKRDIDAGFDSAPCGFDR